MAKKRVNIFGEEVKKREKTLIPILLYLILYIVTVCAGVLSAQATQLHIEVGEICDETIMAPYDFTDEYSTELLRQEAIQKVLPVYTSDSEAETASVGQIQSDFASLEDARSYSKKLYTSTTENLQGNFAPGSVNWEGVLSKTDIDGLLRGMSEYLNKQDIYVAAAMTQDKLADLKATVVTGVTAAYEEGIIADDIPEKISKLLEEIERTQKFSDAQIDTVETILTNSIQANRIYNVDGTEAAKQQAAADVEPVTYKKGENIIRQGDRITQKQYEIISQLGITKDTNTMLPRWISGFILVGVIILVWIIYVMMSDRTLLTSGKKALSIFLLSVVTIGIELICKSISNWIIPVYLAAIVGSALLRPRSAIVYSAFISLLSAFVLSPADSFFFSETTLIVIFSGILGSAAVVLALKDKLHRSEYVLSGLIAGAINAMVYIAYGVMNDYSISTYFYMSLIGLANGLVCGLLSVGILPVWEALFKLDTPSKLLEIASPDSDLLKRMMSYAPGTYHHSVMVSNLAEAGAEAVGANALLARVGAFYHDIGKLYNPTMFSENQTGKNPHDDLTPVESARVIIAHVTYGKQFADKYKLPRRVTDLIMQHHGNSLVGYFYITAKNKGMEIDERDFRYPGPKPQTKEAGILMLADTVEAATRSMKLTDSNEILALIKKLVKSKYDDGQLDECPLNRRELMQIEQSFLKVYQRANHDRVAYPEEKKK